MERYKMREHKVDLILLVAFVSISIFAASSLFFGNDLCKQQGCENSARLESCRICSTRICKLHTYMTSDGYFVCPDCARNKIVPAPKEK